MSISPNFNTLAYNQSNFLFRKGKVVTLKTPLHALFWKIADLLKGGRRKENQKAFAKVSPLLMKKVEKIETKDFTRLENQKKLKKILLIHAKIEISACNQGILKSKEMKTFSKRVRKVQKSAQKVVAPVKMPEDAYEQIQLWQNKTEAFDLNRWIHANTLQKRFAASEKDRFLPLRGDEVPPLSLLLTNPFKDAKGHKLLGRKLNSSQLRKKYYDGPMVFLRTGRPYTHSVLSLKNGAYFHMGKPNKGKATGLYEDWNDKNMHRYKIFLPSKELIEKIGADKIEAFVQDLNKQAKTNGVKKSTRLSDMLRMFFAIFDRRKKGETYANFWDKRRYFSCSGSITALFAKYGVDFGRQFKKSPRGIHPTDLSKSRYFTPLA